MRDECQEVILSGLRFLQAIQRMDPNRFGYVRMMRALLPWMRGTRAITGSKDGEVVVGDRPVGDKCPDGEEALREETGPLDEEAPHTARNT